MDTKLRKQTHSLKMEIKENLSDKIIDNPVEPYVDVRYVKQFIKLLKKRFCLSEEDKCDCARCKTIKELAGDKLIQKQKKDTVKEIEALVQELGKEYLVAEKEKERDLTREIIIAVDNQAS